MADNRLNKVGVRYIFIKIKSLLDSTFATKASVDALDERIDDIVAEGGEPNVIETVKVNGTALNPDSDKAVDIPVPTKTSDLTNDGDGDSNFATEDYVVENGGKIDVIKKNGTAQTITNKEVDLAIPIVSYNEIDPQTMVGTETEATKVKFDNDPSSVTLGLNVEIYNGNSKKGDYNLATTGLVNTMLEDYSTTDEMDTAIATAIAASAHLKKLKVNTLPSIAEAQPDTVYLVPRSDPETGNVLDEYMVVDNAWEKVGSSDTDLTGYWNETNLPAITTQEIDEAWSSVFGS